MGLKTYFVSSFYLRRIPKEMRAANGNCQKNVLCRTTSKKRLAEILGCSVGYLATWGCSVRENLSHIPQEPETIYFQHPENRLPSDAASWHKYEHHE